MSKLKQLFIKYIAHVSLMEGCNYIDELNWCDIKFDKYEKIILEELGSLADKEADKATGNG